MKILNKDNFFQLVLKFNVLLIFSAAMLTAHLYSSINRTYDSSNVRSKKKMARPLELMVKGAVSEAVPLFQEDIFRKKQLFSQPAAKKPEPGKKYLRSWEFRWGKKYRGDPRHQGEQKLLLF